jgi:hypothetical protein
MCIWVNESVGLTWVKGGGKEGNGEEREEGREKRLVRYSK